MMSTSDVDYLHSESMALNARQAYHLVCNAVQDAGTDSASASSAKLKICNRGRYVSLKTNLLAILVLGNTVKMCQPCTF